MGGTHNYAGHIPSAAISTWDGHQWCNVGDGVFNGNNVVGIGFYQDTLWVACGPYIDGGPVPCHGGGRVAGAHSRPARGPGVPAGPLGAEGTRCPSSALRMGCWPFMACRTDGTWCTCSTRRGER
ncbi:MAG: hypothetical protein IPM68_12530 [Flavobacteriales bacterium]|nr:hypothetical protein [Flavobacteriales bacterium]